MRCGGCEKNVEFPIYEDEVIIQRQPFFGPNAWGTRETGRTVPVCPFCHKPIYGDFEIKDGWIRGPKGMAEKEQWNQVPLQSSSRKAINDG